uniref:CP12 domain-containing protein n=1 Tax=Dunaliella tertiolecta TaxID=3047 RepID=A0A7S3QKW3_DUNTE|mmetsp:Transcript_18248/g.51168  ORF Transcript_18248/g.51168 Transcript_18248/m.51168 type:complete len:114 (-) Transcript_18248:238-579(-)|eukprot:CAMPEP_0202345852 /NCGR_PEP_ID=MMETSP1126-20121109/4906_1 /ASSEMBLY_ACC=CAM_ASM_000457 /TAXON_ID=3047 /ORGANISM="Dunaliella tertiolecta, Strain CCMP1320" /LENGTH=113 /DNA_ID=CAMNT_0048937201 /DNA_START=52 /DNA_END=393 /DNA_ORIENTATION=-
MSFSLAAGSSRAAQVNKPTAPTRRVPAVPRVLRSRVVVRAEVPGDNAAVQQALKKAEAACKDGNSAECTTAWDQVEEVSAAVNDKKNEAKSTDPMDKFCENNEDADECRVYDN